MFIQEKYFKKAFGFKTWMISLPASLFLVLLFQNFTSPSRVLPSQTLLMQQASIQGVDNNFWYNPTDQLPAQKFWLSQNFPSPANQEFVCPNSLGTFTGFSPANPSTAQKTISPTWWGGTSVQGEGNTAGILINSDSNLRTDTILPTIFPVVAVYNFDTTSNAIYPWANGSNGGLIYSMDLQIPSAQASDLDPNSQKYSASYATGNFRVKDISTGLEFWLTVAFYDHRGNSQKIEYVHIDSWPGGTNLPIVQTAALMPGELLSTNNGFSTAVWQSAGFQATTWTGYKKIAFAINGQNMTNAINAIRSANSTYAKLSSQLSNYVLEHTNFNPEIYYRGAFGMIATSFQNYKITMSSSIPIPFFRLFNQKLNRHFYTTSATEANAAISNNGYVSEGNAGQLYADAPAGTSLVPLYRLFRASDSDHFLTGSLAEAQQAQVNGNYQLEGIAGYFPSISGCSVNLYRTFSEQKGHFYTTSLAEAKSVAAGAIEQTYCIVP